MKINNTRKISHITQNNDEIMKNKSIDEKNNAKHMMDDVINKFKDLNVKRDHEKNDVTKNEIIDLFNANVKGKQFIKQNESHDGEEGYWLEKNMNVKINSSNLPDLGGYEMKKDSKKITFGDWSADEYLFSNKHNILNDINGENIMLTKEQFIKSFGNKTKDKTNRYSWSGSCVPKYGVWNSCGQIIKIDKNNNIVIMYSYNKDDRKSEINKKWENREICIALWTYNKLKNNVERKFNQKGFFICKKNKEGFYDKICFGSPISCELFLNKIKDGSIFFDSGMYFDFDKPNNRLYSQWRANNKFWNDLIIEDF
jgi:hypothetical protein